MSQYDLDVVLCHGKSSLPLVVWNPYVVNVSFVVVGDFVLGVFSVAVRFRESDGFCVSGRFSVLVKFCVAVGF